MEYLNVSPMISALRSQPDDFEMNGQWLRHTPSHHRFWFDNEGNVMLSARCNCSLLSISHEQGTELWAAFKQWHATYWRAVEINREFASHFRRPPAWRRWLRALAEKMRRARGAKLENVTDTQRVPVVSAE